MINIDCIFVAFMMDQLVTCLNVPERDLIQSYWIRTSSDQNSHSLEINPTKT